MTLRAVRWMCVAAAVAASLAAGLPPQEVSSEEAGALVIEALPGYEAVPEGPFGSGALTVERVREMGLGSEEDSAVEAIENGDVAGFARVFTKADGSPTAVVIVAFLAREAAFAEGLVIGARSAASDAPGPTIQVRAEQSGGTMVTINAYSIPDPSGIEDGLGVIFRSDRRAILVLAVGDSADSDLRLAVELQSALTPINAADSPDDQAERLGAITFYVVAVGGAVALVTWLIVRSRRRPPTGPSWPVGTPPWAPGQWPPGGPPPPPPGQLPPPPGAWPPPPPPPPPHEPPPFPPPRVTGS